MISRADILLIVGILILAVAGLFAWKKLKTPGAYVDIMIDGDSVKTLQLDQDTSYEVKQQTDRKSTRLNSSHLEQSRMPSSA